MHALHFCLGTRYCRRYSDGCFNFEMNSTGFYLQSLLHPFIPASLLKSIFVKTQVLLKVFLGVILHRNIYSHHFCYLP